MSRIMSRCVARVCAAACVLVAPSLASAELPAARATLERLRLTPFGEGVAVHGVARDLPRTAHLGVLAHYQSGPVVGFDGAGDAFRELVADRLTLDVVGGFRLDSWIEIGARLPVILQESGDTEVLGGETVDSFGVGDPELSVRAVLIRPESGLGLALIGASSLPASGGNDFIGERGGTFSPTVALTRHLGSRATLGLDLGATVRWEDTELDPLGGGNELFASLGGIYRFDGGVSLIAELLSDTGAADPFAEDGYGVEALGAVRADLGGGWNGILGGGTGLVEAYGRPEFRVLAGLGWTMPEPVMRRTGPEPLARDDEFEAEYAAMAAAYHAELVEEEPAVEAAPAPVARPVPAVAEARPSPVVAAATRPAPRPRAYAPRGREMVAIRFPYGGTELTSDARRDLDGLVDRLGGNVARIVWRVEGHSDNAGPLVPNRRLSRARAEAVRDYLKARGLGEPWREDWYGPSFPVADNATAAGRAQNRRADVTVVIE